MAAGMVIVGAGECGSRAALALRDNGYAGPVTLIGAETHVPYERPPLSKAVLCDGAPTLIADAARLDELGIRHLQAEATAIDRVRGVVVTSAAEIAYERLLLATGARPRKLDRDGIVYLRDMADCVALRQRLTQGTKLTVIGGGFLGLEIAASARQRGADVTVLETQPRLMQRGVPPEIADVIGARHRAAGVEICCSVVITDELLADADVIAAAIGAIPNTALADAADLAVANGIVVDATLRTSDPAIFAAGDCCAFPLPIYDNRIVRLESWRSAGEHAAIAARNMLGATDSVSAVPWFWSDQYDLTLQVAGFYDPSQTTVRRDLGDGAFVLFHLDGNGRLVAASGIGNGNAVARDIKLAEMLIARRASPDPAQLSAPTVRLKSLLAA
jgi:3-phenylpropionate/trans-cinnamate dioxygenase ferredoxin reductase subunit